MSTQTMIACLALSMAAFAPWPQVCLASGSAPRSGGKAIRIKDLAKRYGAAAPQREAGDTLTVVSGSERRLSFSLNSRKVIADDVLVWLNGPARRHRRTWSLSVADGMHTVAPLLAPSQFPLPESPGPILIDPGHGGSDTGAMGVHKTPEHVLTLILAEKVCAQLDAAGFRCALTRRSDVPLSLAQRTSMARMRQARLFVSIHLNSASNPASSGLETFALTAADYPSTAFGSRIRGASPGNVHDSANTRLAYDVHRAVLSRTRQVDRGIKRARYYVLREAPCPAALIECGFLSNAEEEARLNSAATQDMIAEGIAEGIMAACGNGVIAGQ